MRGLTAPSNVARVTFQRQLYRLLGSGVAIYSAALGSGCGATQPETQNPGGILRPAERDKGSPTQRPAGGSVIRVGTGSLGPYVARGARGSLLVWATEQEPEGFWTQSLDLSGQADGAPRRVDAVPGPLGLVHVADARRGEIDVLFSTRGDEAGLWLLALAEGGELRAPARRLAEAPNDLLWLTQVPARSGSLLFWAEYSGAQAQIFSLPLDAKGQPKTRVTRLHGSATAWQVRPAEYGALFAVVNAARKVELLQVDADAETLTLVEVPESVGARGDLDLAASGDQWIVSFSRAGLLEPHVMSAVFDASLKPVQPVDFAVPALGAQRLVQLAPGPSNYIAWQNLVQEPDYVRVARLNKSGKAEGAELLVPLHKAPSGTEKLPEFVSATRGLHALFWSCPESPNCEQPLLPTLLALDPKLDARSISASKFGDAAPDLTWGLSCSDENCLALSALFAEPPRISVLSSEARGSWVTQAFKADQGWPQAQSSRAVHPTKPLADFDLVVSGEDRVLVWLTEFDPNLPYVKPKTPAPDGKLAPVRSELWTQVLSSAETAGGASAPAANPTIISYRAHSVSGIATATRGEQTLLAWTALDNNQPQVFTTLLDARGAKLSQRMLTRKPGEVQELSAVALADGFALAWLDERRGRLETYVAKLDPKLQRKSEDTRLGDASVSGSGVTIAALGNEAWVVRTVASDVILTRLDAVKFTQVAEVKLHTGEAPASPVLAATDSGFMLAWLEFGETPSVLYLSLDAAGRPSAVASLPLESEAQSLALECAGSRCTAVVSTLSAGGGGEFWQARLEPRGSFESILNHSAALPVAPQLRGDELWFYSPLQSVGQPAGATVPALHRALLAPMR